MTLTFFSPQTGTVACDVSLRDLLSEFIDANADTVCLMTESHQTELEWSAHCDYLRALQRLGYQTLARHDQRMAAAPPLALVAVTGLKSALSRSWMAVHLIICRPARAGQALHPRPQPPRD